MANSVFKSIFPAYKLEEAAIITLAKWVPTYIREVERQMEMPVGEIAYPTYYGNRNSFDMQSADSLPYVVAVSPGLSEAPKKNGSQQYSAIWDLGIGIVVAAPDETKANALAKLYGAAVRAILMQQSSLGGIANEITWVGERYPDVPVAVSSQLAKVAEVFFTVLVEDVVTKWAGPDVPDNEPYAYGIAEHVVIDIVKEVI